MNSVDTISDALEYFATTNYTIDNKWFISLRQGTNYAFDHTLISHYVADNVLIINSIDKYGGEFSISALKYLRNLLLSHDSLILASSVSKISTHLANKYGLSYNCEKNFYYKGLLWVG